MLYLDASAMIKLIVEEPESGALRGLAEGDGDLVASELLLAEIPRALRRRASDDRAVDLARLVAHGERQLATVGLMSVTRSILTWAGGLAGPRLRALDAIHVATAASYPGEPPPFVSYDDRQLEAAELAGLRVASPSGALER